jgi:hypothetical protein
MCKDKNHTPLHLLKQAPHHMRYKGYNSGYHLRRTCYHTRSYTERTESGHPCCFWHTVTFHGHHRACCYIPRSPQCTLLHSTVTTVHTVTFHGHHSAYCNIPRSSPCILLHSTVTTVHTTFLHTDQVFALWCGNTLLNTLIGC